jgi:hypothetical protein
MWEFIKFCASIIMISAVIWFLYQWVGFNDFIVICIIWYMCDKRLEKYEADLNKHKEGDKK